MVHVFRELYSITLSPVRDEFLSLFVQTEIQSVPRDLRPIKLNKFCILSGIRASIQAHSELSTLTLRNKSVLKHFSTPGINSESTPFL
jgi:hypothetical protein